MGSSAEEADLDRERLGARSLEVLKLLRECAADARE
jgi:hypothetical protein